MKDTSLVWFCIGLIFIGISIPLILEKVPPNNWYGFRVTKTFSNERIWYVANKAAGYNLMQSGVAIAVTSMIMGLFINQLGSNTVNFINITVFVIAIVIAVIRSFLDLNRL